MNCSEFDRILNEHQLDALTAADRKRFDVHLRGCERCASAWVGHELIAAEAPAKVPVDMFTRITTRIEARDWTRPTALGRRRLMPFGLAAATALAAVAIYMFVVSDSVPTASSDGAAASLTTPVPAPEPGPGLRGLIDSEMQGRFVAGRHYQELPPSEPVAAGRVQVAEFFMYDCIHCYNFEGSFDPWCQAQPDYVDILRVPVLFNARARLHARAFYTADALGKLDELHAAFYRAIHEDGQSLESESDLAGLFAEFDVDQARFDRVFNSAAVQRMLLEGEALNRRYGIQSTPSLVVAGRYLTGPAMAGSYETLLEVADQLVAMAAEAALECGRRNNCPMATPLRR
jgi:thiol:disulfide interchange protein DsbA